MGAYLSSPNTEKHSEDNSNSNFVYGVSGMQGWRTGMEDAHLASLDIESGISVFGVYDGHGGKEVAQFVALHFVKALKENQAFKDGNYEQALIENYLKMDELLQTKEGKKDLTRIQRGLPEGSVISDYESEDMFSIAGCTAVTAIVKDNQVVVANAGDSRCILVRGGDAFEMSEDHKPDNTKEKARIIKAGGCVEDGRVNGNLNLSRSIGDLEYKKDTNLSPQEQLITAYPEIRTATLTTNDEFMVLACDGVWDMMTNQQVAEFVLNSYKADSTRILSKTCEDIFDKCLAPDVATSGGLGCDNMTCLIVRFLH